MIGSGFRSGLRRGWTLHSGIDVALRGRARYAGYRGFRRKNSAFGQIRHTGMLLPRMMLRTARTQHPEDAAQNLPQPAARL